MALPNINSFIRSFIPWSLIPSLQHLVDPVRVSRGDGVLRKSQVLHCTVVVCVCLCVHSSAQTCTNTHSSHDEVSSLFSMTLSHCRSLVTLNPLWLFLSLFLILVFHPHSHLIPPPNPPSSWAFFFVSPPDISSANTNERMYFLIQGPRVCGSARLSPLCLHWLRSAPASLGWRRNAFDWY